MSEQEPFISIIREPLPPQRHAFVVIGPADSNEASMFRSRLEQAGHAACLVTGPVELESYLKDNSKSVADIFVGTGTSTLPNLIRIQAVAERLELDELGVTIVGSSKDIALLQINPFQLLNLNIRTATLRQLFKRKV